MALQSVREAPESPAPDWVAPIVRWLFQDVPQWVQMAGGFIIAAVAIALAYVIWTRRDPIRTWLTTRSARSRAILLGALGVTLVAAATIGWASWDYMQHDNDFCTGCHIMSDPFERFSSSEHADLSCHDCHQQSIFDSAYQLHMWVTERPTEIGDHAPVPDETCATCHVLQDADSTWQRIASTAGHRVHLESDSVDLADVQCVTCHGEEVHRFVPVDQTCAGSGCHAAEDTEVVLGTMAGQTGLHCVVCHAFTAEVAAGAASDSAHAALSPRQESCLGCHEMQVLLADFRPEEDPHEAACGLCHNPHVDATPEAAEATCATGNCHAQADTLTPFHLGLAEGVLESCDECHGAHTFSVDGENCAACHQEVAGLATLDAGRRNAVAVAPTVRSSSTGFGVTLASLTTTNRTTTESSRRYAEILRFASLDSTPEPGADEFDHWVHRDIACTDCHGSERSHGEVTITERECQTCHHTGPVARGGCASCHSGAAAAPTSIQTMVLNLSVWDEPRTRNVAFAHDAHDELACAECHVRGPLLAVERDCASCHVDHHEDTADCVACHLEPVAGSHTRAAHTSGCAGSGCHEGVDVTASTTAPNTCLSCHQDQIDHEPGSDCVTCHWIPHAERASRRTAVR